MGKASCRAVLATMFFLLLLASGAQASRFHGNRALRWGGPTQRALGAHSDRVARRAAVRPAIGGSGTIEGTVRDAVEGTGIAGIEACAYGEEPEEVDCARSTSGGHYAIEGLAAGEYSVEFSTPFNGTLDYVAEEYEELVDVSAGGTVSGIDIELSKGGEIEGHVTSAVGGASLAGIEVCGWDVNGYAASCAETNSAGGYLITGVPTASVKVEFHTMPGSEQGYVTQFYNDQSSYQSANPISVEAGQKQEGIDAAMTAGAEIQGQVTIGETGAASSEALVCAIDEEEEVADCAGTNSFGEYTLNGLASGSYTIVFLAEGPPEFYDQAFAESEATRVTVTAPGDVRNIDAKLPTLPTKVVAPHVTGSAAVGSTLTCELGAYSAVPAPTLTVQWLRNGEAIAGATSASYTVQAADAGHQLQCKVTATNIVGWLWVTTAGIPIPIPAPTPSSPSTPPPGGGGVLPSVTVVPLAAVASRVSASHRLASVRLKCSIGPCKGTAQLLLRVVSHHHARTIVLATGSFSLQAGASGKVTMRLTAAGRSRLAHAAHHTVATKLKVSLHGGATTTHAVSTT